MSRCGWSVTAYEPDPNHLTILERNLALNSASNIRVIDAAVSDESGTREFVRVKGNTTSSHLSGSKDSYGELDRFSVNVQSIKVIMAESDFIKLDVEGQEKTIILSTLEADWESTDMMLEIGSAENAAAIFNHANALGLKSYSQKNGWKQVISREDVPTSYREGSLFISQDDTVPWI